MGGYWVDVAAVGFFVLEWLVYGITLEHSAYGRDSLSARMNRYREVTRLSTPSLRAQRRMRAAAGCKFWKTTPCKVGRGFRHHNVARSAKPFDTSGKSPAKSDRRAARRRGRLRPRKAGRRSATWAWSARRVWCAVTAIAFESIMNAGVCHRGFLDYRGDKAPLTVWS
jgi:hypothetical protein